MNRKVKKVKDKEGIIFMLLTDNKVEDSVRNRKSSKYVQNFIRNELDKRNVFPLNNVVGFNGEIETISYFISCFIESYIKENKFLN